MEYGRKIPTLVTVLIATQVAFVAPARAEHASSTFNPFGSGFPGTELEPARPPVVNDGRSLTLPSPAKPPPAAALPPPTDGTEFRITGATVANRATTPTSSASPFDRGYNPPSPNALPPLSVREGYIGLSRVPRSAL